MAASLAARTLARPSFEAAFARARLRARDARVRGRRSPRRRPPRALIPPAAADGDRAARAQRCASTWTRWWPRASARPRSPCRWCGCCARRSRARASAAAHVHFGATSQDVLDTAMALCLKPCLEEADRALEAAVRALARRAREHRATPMLGRTLMQPAVPITAGLKIARWAMALAQDRERLAEAQASALAVQLGGPVGALEALGATRPRGAPSPGAAPRASPTRARGTCIATPGSTSSAASRRSSRPPARSRATWRCSSQPEVGEMREAAAARGRGRSSAMPHKRNPVGLRARARRRDARARACSRRCTPRAHRRARARARRLAGRARHGARASPAPSARASTSSRSSPPRCVVDADAHARQPRRARRGAARRRHGSRRRRAARRARPLPHLTGGTPHEQGRLRQGHEDAPQGARRRVGGPRDRHQTPFNAEFQELITRYALGRDLEPAGPAAPRRAA